MPLTGIPANQDDRTVRGAFWGEAGYEDYVAIVASACVVAALFCNLAYSQDDVLSGDEAAVVKARVQKIRGLKLKTMCR